VNRQNCQASHNQPQANPLPECQNTEDATNTFKHFFNKSRTYKGRTSVLGCPTPCHQISYSIALTDLHLNSVIQPHLQYPEGYSKNYYIFYVIFGSVDVERQVETLVYDSGNFFAAVGGNLGLFLGFSCLSIIFACINWVVRTFVRK
jgi:hypothetical protein